MHRTKKRSFSGFLMGGKHTREGNMQGRETYKGGKHARETYERWKYTRKKNQEPMRCRLGQTYLLGFLQGRQQLHLILDVSNGHHLCKGLMLSFGAAASGQRQGQPCVHWHHHIQGQTAHKSCKVLPGRERSATAQPQSEPGRATHDRSDTMAKTAQWPQWHNGHNSTMAKTAQWPQWHSGHISTMATRLSVTCKG